MRFEAHDLYDLDTGQYDITMFSGIFYHLPDPIAGLRIAADRTRELLILNTAVSVGDEDGFLRVKHESKDALMSGVHDISWYPTGPYVLRRILASMGFQETRLAWWLRDTGNGIGRLELLAARDAATFAAYDAARTETALAADG
jgi:hypothetical protein